jgi:hypothetical protein
MPRVLAEVWAAGGKSLNTIVGILLKKQNQVRYPNGLHLEIGKDTNRNVPSAAST